VTPLALLERSRVEAPPQDPAALPNLDLISSRSQKDHVSHTEPATRA